MHQCAVDGRVALGRGASPFGPVIACLVHRDWRALGGAGTTLATSGAGADPRAPKLLVGSHSDTQPEGGWLDGALGVIYGLNHPPQP